MKAIEHLRALKLADTRAKYPSVPDIALPKIEYNERTSNGLTKCILDFVNLSGYLAERTGTEGRVIDNRNTYTDVIGRQKTIGSVKRIKTSGLVGSSDLKLYINGKIVAIEIKIGRDRQSQAQKEYQERMEKAGGIYLIIKDFETFFSWFQEFIKQND